MAKTLRAERYDYVYDAHRSLRTRDPAEILPAANIAFVLVKHPVAVEEEGGTQGSGGGGLGHGATIAGPRGVRRFQKA